MRSNLGLTAAYFLVLFALLVAVHWYAGGV